MNTYMFAISAVSSFLGQTFSSCSAGILLAESDEDANAKAMDIAFLSYPERDRWFGHSSGATPYTGELPTGELEIKPAVHPRGESPLNGNACSSQRGERE